MTGRGLKSVTFFNTGRFPYGHIDLDGNTLLTGTNGAGKTTTNQSVLFFYGNSRRERLGISKSDGKLPWAKYMYPYTNSYVFYRYAGLNGDVLLMTYPYSVGTAWRFIGLDQDSTAIDLASIVLDNNIPRVQMEVVNAFVVAGFKPTAQITDSKMYRRILYGDIDYRKEKELAQFRQYALMEAPKDFRHIPEMQSSIFVNSKIGAGALEKAITSGYGMQSVLPLSQIRGQLQGVTEQFEAVQVYLKRGDDIRKMESTAKHYREGAKQVDSILRQIISNRLWWENDIQAIASALELAKTEQLEKLDAFGVEMIAADAEYRKAVENETEARLKLDSAEEKKKRYEAFDMHSIASEVDQIPTLDKERSQKKSEYENSLGGAKTIAGTYDEMLKAEKDGLLEQIRANNEMFDGQKEELGQHKESLSIQYEKEIAELEEQHEAGNLELKGTLRQAEAAYHDALGGKTAIEQANPHLNDVIRLKNDVFETRQGIESAKRESELYVKQIDTFAKRRDEIEQHIQSISEDASRRFEIERKQFDDELQTLAAKLEASGESVLGLVRNKLPEMEEVLASLLKDEILLNTELNPSVIEVHPSAYGLMFDTEALPKSEITKEAIAAKMADIGKAASALQKRIAEETDSRISVLKKEKGEVHKEIYSLKAKKDGTDELITRNSSKLFSLEEDLFAAESAAIAKWEEDKATALKRYEEAKNRHETLRQQVEEASQKLRDAKAFIKSHYREKMKAVSDRIEALKIEMRRKNDNARVKSAEAAKEIEKRRDEALTIGGYSPAKINEFKNAFEAAESRYHQAVSNSGLVLSWRNDKPEIDNSPVMQAMHQTLLKTVETIRERNQKRTAEIDAEKGKMASVISEMENKIANHKMQIADADSILESYEFRHSVEKIMDEGGAALLPPYMPEPASILKQNVNIARSKRDEYGRVALASLQKFLSHISDRDRFVFFECDLSTSESAVRSIENLAEFVESGGLDEIKETIASEIRLIQGNLSVQHESFSSETKSIEMLVQRIDRGLKKAIEKIPVIDELGIRIVRNEHRIFRDLEAIANVDIPYGDTKSLFADPSKSAKSSHEILEHFASLLKHLEDEKAEELTIADTIEVQFKITENGNTSDWSGSKGNIGSAGTSVIVKTLTYIALLNAVIELTQRGKRVPVHVMLDEIGTIDQHNMRQVVDFANENGILFLNAAPDIKIPDRYKNMYLYRLSGGKTKVSRLAVRL